VRKILDDLKRKQIIAVLAVGGTRTLAPQCGGCHPRTIYNAAIGFRTSASSPRPAFVPSSGRGELGTKAVEPRSAFEKQAGITNTTSRTRLPS
jgi:hypothetical protein